MADVMTMPARSGERVYSKENLRWTIRKSFKPGDTFVAQGHTVTVECIETYHPEYNVAVVSVGEPLVLRRESDEAPVFWPALRFDGQFGYRPIAPLGQRG